MTVFKKQKRIEITIAIVVLAITVVGCLLFSILNKIPIIIKYRNYLAEETDNREIETIKRMILNAKMFILLVTGSAISVSNIIDFFLFRSFARIIPKKAGLILLFASTNMIGIFQITMLLLRNSIGGIILGIIYNILSLSITFALFIFAGSSKTDRY